MTIKIISGVDTCIIRNKVYKGLNLILQFVSHLMDRVGKYNISGLLLQSILEPFTSTLTHI